MIFSIFKNVSFKKGKFQTWRPKISINMYHCVIFFVIIIEAKQKKKMVFDFFLPSF